MIVTTTPSIEGRTITAYHGIAVGEAIMGANVFRDLFARVTDIVGGRSGAYESKLQDARAPEKGVHGKTGGGKVTLPQPVIYGLVVTAAIFFVGWSTGMGGSFLPNLTFSAVMGIFAGFLFSAAKRMAGRRK